MFPAIDGHHVAAAARRKWPADVPEDNRHLLERAARRTRAKAGDVGMFWPSEASQRKRQDNDDDEKKKKKIKTTTKIEKDEDRVN
ncbi:hypothetical protein A7C99_3395 [Trichophyton rubrum]|uniref:Uncharacterized protein n=1 Tax=Trichophyton rubrum TaxID=5551 RepID=A0A178F4B2_TRIRU|nr:hypothetical protein HL42_6449 [Trichophyton rubrum]OAL66287.1 hypothetical protein A7C99_3395 [Trichophyton rubrum]